jgi:hypothetical protein
LPARRSGACLQVAGLAYLVKETCADEICHPYRCRGL